MSKKARDLQNPRQVAAMRDIQKRLDEQRVSDLKFIMQAVPGRRFMYDLIFDRCELMSVYPGQDSGIYRNAGARDVGYRLAKEIQDKFADEYVEMIQEHLREQDNLKKLIDGVKASSTDEDGDSDA